jgi:periplasmic divalent cation tolerance protein
MTTDYLVVMTTTDDESLAKRIAEQSVERRVAACVQIVGPLTSVYRWKGKVETATEYRCEMKTTSAHFEAVRDIIRELHSYDTPEIISIPIVDISADYGLWLEEQLGAN